MTNREWLMTLSDRDLALWLIQDTAIVINGKLIPTLHNIARQYLSSLCGVQEWLKEKRE